MSTSYDKLIIDGNNFLFRAFFVKIPDKIVNGVNVTPIHKFLSMLKNSVKRFQPKEIVFTWDKKLNSTKKNFRKDLVPYKEQRVESEKTVQLFKSLEHIQKFLDALGIKTVYPVNMEADDVIRYLSLENDKKILIVSSDKDLLQLVRPNVDIYLPNKDVVVDVDNFESIIDVKRELFVVYKSMIDDVSDNITGLDRVGHVRAKVIAEKIVDGNEIKFEEGNLSDDQIAILKRNLQVVDLKNTEIVYPDEYTFYEKQYTESEIVFDADELKNLFKEYHFHNFLNSFGEWNNLFNADKENSDLLSRIVM